MSQKGTEDVLPVSKGTGPRSASLSDPHLRLAAGYQMAFDARKLAGWSQEGEKPGQRVGVIQLPAPRTGQDREDSRLASRAGVIHSWLAGCHGDLTSGALLGPGENECPFRAQKVLKVPVSCGGAEQAYRRPRAPRAPESGWGWGELHVPKER